MSIHIDTRPQRIKLKVVLITGGDSNTTEVVLVVISGSYSSKELDKLMYD